MLRTIPKNKYKAVKIGKNVTVTGFKSEIYEYPNGLDAPSVLNEEHVHLKIITNCDSSEFKLRINGRKNLLKLKNALDFALETEDKKNNEWYDKIRIIT